MCELSVQVQPVWTSYCIVTIRPSPRTLRPTSMTTLPGPCCGSSMLNSSPTTDLSFWHMWERILSAIPSSCCGRLPPCGTTRGLRVIVRQNWKHSLWHRNNAAKALALYCWTKLSRSWTAWELQTLLSARCPATRKHWTCIAVGTLSRPG